MYEILIVDDDSDFAEAIGAFLRSHGFSTVRARDGREGLRLAKMRAPDLIVMDIVMDQRTEGLFAAREIRRTPQLANVPIFIATSLYAQVDDFTVTPETGWMACDEIFAKPVDLADMLARIRRRLPALERAP